ncbi:hypothetical protein [Photobacterium leiognathi]|uniref:hypothetical protein n=1 Tax=Photobacterium leiognathi TaxID=553611 RepID=UPI0027392994|nr:hypothetical protein [Photobacterium leiognathi]
MRGVHTEGVAAKNNNGIYELLDSSRRRFCCIHLEQELPLWVIDDVIDDSADLVSFITTTHVSVKRLSYRELGSCYSALMSVNGFTKLDELAEHLLIGRETCRKRYVAASIRSKID